MKLSKEMWDKMNKHDREPIVLPKKLQERIEELAQFEYRMESNAADREWTMSQIGYLLWSEIVELREALERYKHIKLFDDRPINGPVTAESALAKHKEKWSIHE